MLKQFTVKNYRSFRDKAILDLQIGFNSNENDVCLIKNGNSTYLPAISIYGKNGGGKSNLYRAMWLAITFIKNAQLTQNEKAKIPVRPFELNDYSLNEPTEFDFLYTIDEIQYQYGFSATKEKIITEYLYIWPKNKKSIIFERQENNIFSFPKNPEQARKQLISENVANNQLFLVIACLMNYKPCIEAMSWFRDKVFFSKDYKEIETHLIEYEDDIAMLNSIVKNTKSADLGISNIKFEFDNIDITNLEDIPKNIPEHLKETIINSLPQLKKSLLSNNDKEMESYLTLSKIKTELYHLGTDSNGNIKEYVFGLNMESDGTRRLMALSPALENVLRNGGVFIVDELERELHPELVDFIVKKFTSKDINTNGAQIIFTTHNTELLSRDTLRRDQIYFVDKNNNDGASILYPLTDFSPRKESDIFKAYSIGKFGAIPFLKEE